MKKIFLDRQKALIFLILCLSTLFGFALLWGRQVLISYDWSQINSIQDLMIQKGNMTFLFLIWNLFLAWIPYWIAISLKGVYRFTKSKILIGLMLVVWLLFFPNAPYIVTDLLHLRVRPPVPLWYDLMMFVSFAWTGLMLGYQSLYEVQLFLEKSIGSMFSWGFALTCIPLAGLGVFIGRFQRWNSWDVVTQPFALGEELLNTFLNPSLYGHTLGLALVLSGFMLIGYLMMLALIKK